VVGEEEDEQELWLLELELDREISQERLVAVLRVSTVEMLRRTSRMIEAIS
jgi:hypothetical protein